MGDVVIDNGTVVVLSSDHVSTIELPAVETVHVVRPADVDEETLTSADAVVVTDAAGIERVVAAAATAPVVALVEDPSDPVATASIVDAIATDLDAVDARIRWLASRRRDDPDHEAPSSPPSRIEQLHAGTTRLASARSTEEAYRTAVAIAEDVFAFHHCTIGVVDGDWVEPVAISSDVALEDCSRVRVGAGLAGAVVETGESRIDTDLDGEFRSSLAVPVGTHAVFQAVSARPDAFDGVDLDLAELLASHLEETLSRIRTDEELRTERDRLLALFENVPDAAVAYDYVDGDPIVRRVNRVFEETFGYDAAAVVGESLDEYIIPPDDEAEREADELNAKLQSGENLRREVTRETVDGPRHFLLYVIPIQLDAANVSGYAIYTDVTERREREAMLRRQNERLDEFTSIVSHDLRNPLSVAAGYLDLARETGDEEHFERVENALDRMDELVTDLLSLAREGEVVGDTEPVSLAALANEAWANVDTGDARLVVESDRTFEGDRNRVRELLENLFRNSVEHGSTHSRTQSGDSAEHGTASGRPEKQRGSPGATASVPVTVRVGAAEFRSDGCEGFYVEDDGRGLPDTDAERLFESGFSTGNDGTGLGLAIGRHIAEAHGWEVRALSSADGGARFEFSF